MKITDVLGVTSGVEMNHLGMSKPKKRPISFSDQMIRAERVQDITEEDAVAEGVATMTGEDIACFHVGEFENATEHFQRTWNSIHGPGAWERNDWVRVIEFKRVEL